MAVAQVDADFDCVTLKTSRKSKGATASFPLVYATHTAKRFTSSTGIGLWAVTSLAVRS